MPKFMIVYEYRKYSQIIRHDVQFSNNYDTVLRAVEHTKDYYDVIKIEIYAYSNETGYVRLGN